MAKDGADGLPDETLPNFAGCVLIVDDNPVNQLVASGLLQVLGVEVGIANNGAEALRALEKTAYDLVLMDCEMPVMDGFQATCNIRRNEQQNQTLNQNHAADSIHRIPIIATTANTVDINEARCFAAGMDGFISKPINMSELVATLARWLKQTLPL